MLKFCRDQWHTIGFCRRLLLIFMLGLLGASAAWVALADNTNYSSEDTHIEEAFALLDLFSDSTNASLWLDTNTLSWACFVRLSVIQALALSFLIPFGKGLSVIFNLDLKLPPVG